MQNTVCGSHWDHRSDVWHQASCESQQQWQPNPLLRDDMLRFHRPKIMFTSTGLCTTPNLQKERKKEKDDCLWISQRNTKPNLFQSHDCAGYVPTLFKKRVEQSYKFHLSSSQPGLYKEGVSGLLISHLTNAYDMLRDLGEPVHTNGPQLQSNNKYLGNSRGWVVSGILVCEMRFFFLLKSLLHKWSTSLFFPPKIFI